MYWNRYLVVDLPWEWFSGRTLKIEPTARIAGYAGGARCYCQAHASHSDISPINQKNIPFPRFLHPFFILVWYIPNQVLPDEKTGCMMTKKLDNSDEGKET